MGYGTVNIGYQPKPEKTVLTLTHSKSETIHTLAGLPDGFGLFTAQFKATADFVAGDTFAGGYTAKPTGEETALPDKAFISGDLVSVSVDKTSKMLYFAVTDTSAFLQADPAGKLPVEKLPDTIDADTLGGKAANQFAQLDESGKLPVDSLPPGAKDTAAEILGKLKTVDGTGSGLDADLLDGKQAEYFAPKSTSVNVTLTAVGWSGNAQTVSVSGLGATQNGVVGIAATATQPQREAARAALLSVTAQAAGSLTITADGDKPSVNIPLTVTLMG